MQTSFLPQPEKNKTKPHPARYVGASNEDRADDDFYPTPTGATLALIQAVEFPKLIWEPACGDGAISRVLESAGYQVFSSDLVDRGFGVSGVDFFCQSVPPNGCTALATNPPYEVKTLRGKFTVEDWIKHAWAMPQLEKMAMFLKTTALGGQRRSVILEQSNLAWVLQFRGRVTLLKNGVKTKDDNTGMIDFAWYIFERNYNGFPRVRWIEEITNPGQSSLFSNAVHNKHIHATPTAAP